MGTQLLINVAQQPSPLFGPCLFWPNAWLDQDATWYGGKPRRWPHCVRLGPDSPGQKKAAQPHSPRILGPCLLWPRGWMIKMPLGMEVCLGSGHIVLDGDPALPTKRSTAPPTPKFRPMSVVVKWMDGSRCHLVHYFRSHITNFVL